MLMIFLNMLATIISVTSLRKHELSKNIYTGISVLENNKY